MTGSHDTSIDRLQCPREGPSGVSTAGSSHEGHQGRSSATAFPAHGVMNTSLHEHESLAGRHLASVVVAQVLDDDADRSVIARVAAGDLAALEELYDRYRGMAYSLALRITTDPAAAEDVVQDAFLGVWRNVARYAEGRGTVRTWLLSVVHHRAIDTIRRRRPTGTLPDPEAGPSPAALRLPDVWSEVAGRLDAAAVRRALAGLSEVQRQALELGYFGGLTQQEIAERTRTPLGTVKSRVRLGLLALRDALSAETKADDPAGLRGDVVAALGGEATA